MLDISSNPVSSLSGLEPLTKLEEFWASNCKIEDWREIERGLGEKSGKEKLETVYLEGNPIERMGPAVYRGKVKMLVPRVRQIDACRFFSHHSFSFLIHPMFLFYGG